MSKVTIGKHAPLHFDGGHANLLTFFEQHKIPVNYQCREGFCGACRCTLVSGSVRYSHEPLAFVRRGEFLPCCSMPAGDIAVEIPK